MIFNSSIYFFQPRSLSLTIVSPIRDSSVSNTNATPAKKKEEKKDEKTDDDITRIDDKDSDADDLEAARKLADLKNRIIAAGCKVKYHIFCIFFRNKSRWLSKIL